MMKFEKIPDYDSRDPMKKAIGEKLKTLVTLDKKDGGTRLLEFFFSSKMGEEEIISIQHDPEIWMRDNQFAKLGWKDPRVQLWLAGRGST